jgi:hypothetical protein
MSIAPSFGVSDIFTYSSDGSTWHCGLPTPPTPLSDIWAIGCIGYEFSSSRQLSHYVVDSTPKIGSYGGNSANLAQEYTQLYCHLRGWRKYYVDNIFVSTVSLVRGFEHLHTNDQDFNATRSQTQNLGLPSFNY